MIDVTAARNRLDGELRGLGLNPGAAPFAEMDCYSLALLANQLRGGRAPTRTKFAADPAPATRWTA